MKVNENILLGVEQTLLIPLIIKAREYTHKNPIIKDSSAYDIVSRLNVNEKDYTIIKYSAVASLYRSRKIDSYVNDYMRQNPEGLVIEIGVGLDNRFQRLDNHQIKWLSIDLPNVIALRRKLIKPNRRETLMDTPLEKINWKSIKAKCKNPLIISEGVFPYFSKEYANVILNQLNTIFQGCTICFDVVHEFVVKNQKFKALEKNKVRLQWAVNNKNKIMSALPNCQILDEWRYYDTFQLRNGLANFFRFIPFLNNLFRIYKIKF